MSFVETILRYLFWFRFLHFWGFCFCFFYPQLTLSMTISIVVGSGESGHLCLVLHLSGKAFNSSPLSTMLSMNLSYMTFTMLRCIPCIPSVLRYFIMNEYWVLLNSFTALIVIMYSFIFHVVNGVYHIYWFV